MYCVEAMMMHSERDFEAVVFQVSKKQQSSRDSASPKDLSVSQLDGVDW